jgi:hypothetical protein
MAIKTNIILLIFLSWVLGSGISAEEIPQKKSTDGKIEEYVLDEITVTADSSLRSLQMAVIRADESKFEIFNKLNSTDDFDITCKWQIPTGTLIRHWSCVTGYMEKARSEDMDLWHASDWQATPRSDRQLSIEFASEHRALKKEMVDLAVKYPELATAMIRAHELRQLLQEEHKRRFKDSIMIGHSEPVEKEQIVNEIDFWQSVFVHHMRGLMPDDIWERWDSWCKNKLQMKSYQKLWASTNKDKYIDEFKAYVNTIISGE